MAQSNPKVSVVPINNDAGAFTVIRLTTWAKFVEFLEDPSQNAGAQQGLQYNLLDPFAISSNITANAEPTPPAYLVAPAQTAGVVELELGDKYHVQSKSTKPLGAPGSDGNVDVPGGQVTLGTPLIQVRTNSANATNLIVREHY